MKQIALDIGLASGPSLRNFLAGPNLAALEHLVLWSGYDKRSPVPTYLWGESGSGKSHLLRAVFAQLQIAGRHFAAGQDPALLAILRRGRVDEPVKGGLLLHRGIQMHIV